MTPTPAWAPRGERAVGLVPTTWGTVSVIAALGLGGAGTAGFSRRHRYGGVPDVRGHGAGAGVACRRRRGV
ncbi:MAG: hypothetical protein ACXVB5_21750 [Isosphaeraceae bacterium]